LQFAIHLNLIPDSVKFINPKLQSQDFDVGLYNDERGSHWGIHV